MSLVRKFSLASVLVLGLGAVAGERLYNGIELPEVWPPELDRLRTKPMPVPYLEASGIPETILIDIGRQLFVDDFLIGETSNVRRVFHHPEKYAGNPVLKVETKLEQHRFGLSAAVPKSGGMWWDSRRGRFRLWYETGMNSRMAYAESADGLHWERPDLGFLKGTNRLLPDQQVDSWTVVPDPSSPDPLQRWKLYIQPGGVCEPSVCYTSPDGLVWTNKTVSGKSGDRSTMHYNPFRRKWVWSLRGGDWPGRGRSRSYREADDFLSGSQWDWYVKGSTNNVVRWLATDELDLPDPEIGMKPELYNVDAVAYESIMLGFWEILKGPQNAQCATNMMPKVTDLVFSYSRDGFHWSRPDRTAAIPSSRWASCKWDAGYVQPLGNLCVIMGDELWFYFCAFGGNPKKLPGMVEGGAYNNGAMGLAKLRRDGFAALVADREGFVTTRPVRYSGRELFVNLDAPAGRLKVELLEADVDRVLATLPTVSGNGTKIRVGSVAEFAGRRMRFRFTLEKASLYAFWVSATADGASGGYLAGGGPGYDGLRDVRSGEQRTGKESCR